MCLTAQNVHGAQKIIGQFYKNTLVSFNIHGFKLRVPCTGGKDIYLLNYLSGGSNTCLHSQKLSTIHKKIHMNWTRRHAFVCYMHLLIIWLIPLLSFFFFALFTLAVFLSSDSFTQTPVIMERILKLVETEHTEGDNNASPSLTCCLTGCQRGLCVVHWKYLHSKHTCAALFQIKPMALLLFQAKQRGWKLI